MRQIILLLIAISSAFITLAEDKPVQLSPEKIVKLRLNQNGKFKRAPGAEVAICFYSNSTLTFMPSDAYTYMWVSVESDEGAVVAIEAISEENYTVEIGDTPGCYTINCTTDQGQNLVGFFEID